MNSFADASKQGEKDAIMFDLRALV